MTSRAQTRESVIQETFAFQLLYVNKLKNRKSIRQKKPYKNIISRTQTALAKNTLICLVKIFGEEPFLEKNRQTAWKTAHVGKIFDSFIIFLHISKTGFTTLLSLNSSKDKNSRKIAGKKPTLMHIEI